MEKPLTAHHDLSQDTQRLPDDHSQEAWLDQVYCWQPGRQVSTSVFYDFLSTSVLKQTLNQKEKLWSRTGFDDW